MAAPNQPPQTALPLLVAEAQRWGYDLHSVQLGELVIARAEGVPPPTLEDVIMRPPLTLLHGEFRAVDLKSSGLEIDDIRSVLNAGESTTYKLLSGARRKIGARTDEQAARSYMDVGLLPPLPNPPGETHERLSPSEFVVVSLGSRGWKTTEIMKLDHLSRSTVNTFWEHARVKLRARNNEHVVRRALSVGVLAFDRTLISA